MVYAWHRCKVDTISGILYKKWLVRGSDILRMIYKRRKFWGCGVTLWFQLSNLWFPYLNYNPQRCRGLHQWFGHVWVPKIWKRLHLIYFIGALWSWITRRRILLDIYLQLGMHHNKAKKCTTNFAAHVRNHTLAYSTEIWRVWSCDISHMLYKRLQVWG